MEILEIRVLLSAGALDPTFGSNGKVTTNFGPGSFSRAGAVTVQPDGKIIVVGETSPTGNGTVFAMARYNANGTLDASFGSGGKVTTDFAPLSSEALAVHIQPDSKIIVVGQGVQASSSPSVLFARYNADGTLDLAFGVGGKVVEAFSFSSGVPGVGGVAWQADGKIVVAAGLYVFRYNADATPDQSFGSNGSVQVTLSGDEAVAVQPDGKIVVGIQNTYLLRLNPDGSPDITFGQGGLTHFANAQSIVLQPDGRILTNGLTPFSPVRFNVNGTPDNTFSQEQTDVYAVSAPFRLALQADGRVLWALTGHDSTVNGSVLIRYNPDGSRDTSFGSGGMVSTDVISALAIQPDGSIVAASTVSTLFGVVRYLGDSLVAAPLVGYVSQLYLDLLQRPVDPSGLAFSTAFLKQGNSRASLIRIIESSSEYHALVVGYLFGYVFGRPVDDSGRASWVAFLNQGGTAERLEADLLGSQEYFTGTFTRRLGNGTNDAFLAELYGDVLHRPIDPAGQQSWSQALANGVSRATIAASVLASLESDGIEVQALYSRFLRRTADSGGLSAYTSSLQNGVANEEIIASVLGSDEYYSLVMRLP